MTNENVGTGVDRPFRVHPKIAGLLEDAMNQVDLLDELCGYGFLNGRTTEDGERQYMITAKGWRLMIQFWGIGQTDFKEEIERRLRPDAGHSAADALNNVTTAYEASFVLHIAKRIVQTSDLSR